MIELERIIKDYCDGPYPVSEDGTDANGKTYKDFAKAIEQYVLKARIEGANKVLDIVLTQNFSRAKEYVEQLKKGTQ